MSGHLFTNYFLTDGIRHTQERRTQRQAADDFRNAACQLFQDFRHSQDPNEAETEQDLILPLLRLLGWTDYLPQQGTARREDVPDLLLFADTTARDHARALRSAEARYAQALAVHESKRFGRSLDAAADADSPETSATQTAMLNLPSAPSGSTRTPSPHRQMLRYLRTADRETDGHIRWGILTNGAVWRLYDQQNRTAFHEADLQALLDADNEDGLHTFHLLFRRSAFIRLPGAAATFVETALEEGKRYEQRVAQSLAGVVFQRVFPRLLQALADATDEPMSDIREAALIFLYRLLFVLYAEDRGLLPMNDSRYPDYGLRNRVRDDVARRKERNVTFSKTASSYYSHLTDLFGQIDQGDPSIGLPPYNGGLFADKGAAKLLNQVRLPDDVIADVVHDLSHTQDNGQRRYVNYRDMSVQQLGSIYERLLEQEPVLGAEGVVTVRPNPYARKDSGSFYTPQDLVDLIVDQTIRPLVDERRAAFEARANELRSDRRPKAARKAELAKLDVAEAVIDLKVLDPAMGSGHFLVTAVDYLTDAIVDLIEPAAELTGWLSEDDPYRSPLLDRIAAIRDAILHRAAESGWTVNQAQLTDQAIIRRLVLKRCIYGVDKNPLTVELAKVSLWLHSFTVGAPLSFLDHHLRCGDSLLGLEVLEAHQDFERLGGLSASSAIAGAEAAAAGTQRIEQLADADVAEVRQSAGLFEEVEQATAKLRGVLDFLCGLRWQTAGLKQRARTSVDELLAETLGRQPDLAFDLLARGSEAATDGPTAQDDTWREFSDRWTEARRIAQRECFLHWEVVFPSVWRRWQNFRPEGGFDAVIGNPPWDRIEQQEVEWFDLRDPEVALASTGAKRKALIKERQDAGDELALEYAEVRDRATAMRIYARASSHYPLLSGGRTNLYSLFVERALSVVKPSGVVGLLTPSGIYADKTAARFFKSVSTTGRVAGIYDFENRRPGTDRPPFFPDIDSRFKFCALIVGGPQRTFPETRCAFFLPDADTINDSDRAFTLTPDDFARVNPNTGTAPVFRTRRDADLTRRIYQCHPVLVDRSNGKETRTWPVRYVQGLFNMTSDSHLFRTAAQLEDEGFYPVQGNRWKRGKNQFLQLYEGKMVQAFDHRAASVVVNPDNLNRPAQPRETTVDEYADPDWLPNPQFWVDEKEIEWPEELDWVFGFKDITSATNRRTVIASLFPKAAFGNKTPIFLPVAGDAEETAAAYKHCAILLTANFNSFAFDFVARQKVHGQTLNLFILEQLPVIPPDAYHRRFGDRSAADLIHNHVLHLSYTSHDMAPFARDLGYYDVPLPWNEEQRRHLRARLDALYFHLYGLTRDDAAYILSTFPIIQRQDESAFGHYRTKALILAYMNALAAGDTETIVRV